MAATAIATLSATCAYAGGTNDFGGQQYGSWNENAGIGSVIGNSQVTTQTQWSNLNGSIDTVGGDAAVQGTAAGNLMDITTMNNTAVNSSQIVGPHAAIGSNINMDMANIWGSVGIQNQVMCNGLQVSTDPSFSSTHNYQECNASDPASQINSNITNIAGNAAVQSSALGNSFEADSNAPNMPVWNKQVNNSISASTVNTNIYNIAGSTSVSSSAIGNTGQVIHYNTN
jgi:hypothetical protein